MTRNIARRAGTVVMFVLVTAVITGAVVTPALAAAEPSSGFGADDRAALDTASSQTTPNATATPTPGESFRVGPDVNLRPVEDEITRRQAGIIELFVNNPTVNDKSITVSVRISVPSGVQMTGEDLGRGSGAGTVVGSYEVPAGSSRTITMRVFPTETDEFTVDARVLYWPTGNKDAFNQFTLTHSFSVSGTPDAPEDAVAPGQTTAGGEEQAQNNGGSLPTVPTSVILLVVGAGVVLAVIVYAWQSGAEVVIEE